MRGLRLDRVLTRTALALVQIDVLAAGNVTPARAETPAHDLKAIEALVPLPETADVPPPTIADIGGLAMPEPAVGAVVPEPAPVAVQPAAPAAAATPEPAESAPGTAHA